MNTDDTSHALALISLVRDEPFIPEAFAKPQTGVKQTLAPVDAKLARWSWLQARDAAVRTANDLALLGVDHSIIERLLEPFANDV